MKVDFLATDRALVLSASDVIKKRLENAASACRAVGHSRSATEIESDLHFVESFQTRYAGLTAEGEASFAGTLDVPNSECVVIRQGILLLLERHQRTESTLQEELDLSDNGLVRRLGDLRDLGTRFGGQPSLFKPEENAEKTAMAEELGLSGAAVGASPATKRPKKKVARGKLLKMPRRKK